jgi:uncharacterized protein (DUF427 family)
MTNASAITTRLSGYAARPGYRVDLLRRPNRLTASVGGREIASSDRAILVDEQDHALIAYFPSADVDMTALVRLAARTTHCPFKGDAHYWTLTDAPGDPVAWSYAAPYAEVAAIAGHIAFYQDRVDVRLAAKAG